MENRKYEIIEGVVFRPYGERSLITNENLTDAMAEMFINRDPKLLGTVFKKIAEQKKVGRKKNKF